MSKQFIAVLLVVAAAFVGLVAFTGDKNENGNGGGQSTSQTTNHVKWAEDSSVTLVEYGDFQCPACKSYAPLISQLESTHGDKVKFQFRHYPLVQIHPNAFLASRAAEAAGKQGKFFEMHDLLYENQESWASSQNSTPIFESFAQQLELNIEQFKTDMNSSETAAAINADVKDAQAAGASSTPTFVLNGRKINQNPQSLDEFKKLLDDELAKNQ